MKVFTLIPYPEGDIKAGNARFHALMQLDLHSFGQNNLGFPWVQLPHPPPVQMACCFLIQLCILYNKTVWFIVVEVEHETRLNNLFNVVMMVVWHVTSAVSYAFPKCCNPSIPKKNSVSAPERFDEKLELEQNLIVGEFL